MEEYKIDGCPKLSKIVPPEIIHYIVVSRYNMANCIPNLGRLRSHQVDFDDWVRETFFEKYIKDGVFDKESWLAHHQDYIFK